MHRRSRRSRSRRSALVLSVAAVAAAPLLTACGSDAHPGAAAVVDGKRITVAQLEQRVKEVRDAVRTEVKDDAQYEQFVAQSGTFARESLQGMLGTEVVHRAAKDAGVTASRKDVQAMRANLESQAGSLKNMKSGMVLQYGVAPERIDEYLQFQLEIQNLTNQLGPDAQSALTKASRELDIEINPRYGTWDVAKIGRVDAKTPWLREVSSTAKA